MGVALHRSSTAPLVRVRIWDLPTRLFHWLLAACVVASIVSAKIGGNAMVWHFRFGYVLLGLLSFRIIWGVVGGRWSRFRSFVRPPAEIVRHLRGGAATPIAGHNPVGALSVLAMLGVLAAQAGSGLFADDEIASSGPLMPLVSGATSSLLTTWHKAYGQWIVIGLVVLHVCAVLWYLWRKRVTWSSRWSRGTSSFRLMFRPQPTDGHSAQRRSSSLRCAHSASPRCFAMRRPRLADVAMMSRAVEQPPRPTIELISPSTPELLTEAVQIIGEYAASLQIDLCFQDFETELRQLPGDYALPRGQLLLALVEGVVAGCGAFRPMPESDYPNACEMKRLYVRPAFRSFGIGRLLVQALARRCQARRLLLGAARYP